MTDDLICRHRMIKERKMDHMYNCVDESSSNMAVDETKETVKGVLEETDEILKDLANVLRMVDDAVYGKSPAVEENGEPHGECLLAILYSQRKTAWELLDKALHIKEGLW